MEFNYKKLSDEQVAEAVAKDNKVFINVDGNVCQASVTQVIKAIATKSHAVTEEGAYLVDATELNPSVEGSFANKVNSNLNPDYSRYTFTQYKSGELPVITASERVDVLITVSIAYNGNSLILFPAVNGVGLTHPIGGGRSMVSTNTFANVSYSETIRLGEGDTLNFSVIGSLADTNSVSIGLLPYK